jgi:hypothetical protein
MCDISNDLPSQLWLYRIPNFALSAALLILAIFQTLKQSFQMYKATKRWQPNQYLKLLTTDGILYFIMYVFQVLPFYNSSPPSTFTAVFLLIFL